MSDGRDVRGDHPVGDGRDAPVDRSVSTFAMARLVAQREIVSRLRDRAFLISTVLLLVLVAAGVAVPLVMEHRNGCSSRTVGVVGVDATRIVQEAARLGRASCDAARARDTASSDRADQVRAVDPGVAEATLTVRQLTDLAAAEAAVVDGSVDVAVVLAPGAAGGGKAGAGGAAGGVQLLADSSVPVEVSDLVIRAAASDRLTTALKGTGVDPTTVTTALGGAAPTQRLLQAGAENHDLAVMLGFVFAFLFYFTVLMFGMAIAQSVVEEKQSRIIELLVSAVPVRALLLGKVGGNTLLALGQVVLLTAVGLAGASIGGQSGLVTVLLQSSGWFVLFFLLGFVMLSCLWAAAGALASRQEELQSTASPLMMLVMIPFFASLPLTEPSRWLTALSYLPFTAPLVMPRRLAMGDAAWWEALLSAGGVLITAGAIIAVGTRLYQGALMRTRTRVTWREAWTRAA